MLALCLVIPRPVVAVDESVLLERLRAGGLVIAMSAAEHGPGSGAHVPVPGCAPDTRLTRAGWQDALAVGTGLRKGRVFVEWVHAGPGCAARHSAYLAFGADRVHHDPGLAASCDDDAGLSQAHRGALLARLAERAPYPRTNLAVVVDACILRHLADSGWPECARKPGPGDAVIFDPARGAAVVGCLDLETLRIWSRWPE